MTCQLDLGAHPARRDRHRAVQDLAEVKEKQIDAQTNLAAEKSAQYAAHVERIEARLRVLEQIVTDGGARPPRRSKRCATSRAIRVADAA